MEYVYRCPEHGEITREPEPILEKVCTEERADGQPCRTPLVSTRSQSNTNEDAA